MLARSGFSTAVRRRSCAVSIHGDRAKGAGGWRTKLREESVRRTEDRFRFGRHTQKNIAVLMDDL